VSVAADSATAVGAGVGGGTVVVVVVGATVVVEGATVVVVGASVVVVTSGTAVVIGATVEDGVVSLKKIVDGGDAAVVTVTEGTTAAGVGELGTYPQPDNAMVLEILIVEMTFAPLFKRS
jgi:hypothetical protein